MSNSRHVDYVNTYFPHPVPTKIEGEPSYKTLTTLLNELKSNASSVDSDLGGGDHGYLGLVLSDADYALIPGTVPFVAPGFPGALNVPATATQVEAFTLKENHEENTRKYRECANVERALQRHLQKAIEKKYLASFLDEDTGLLSSSIPDIMDHLFQHHGHVRGEEVKTKEAEMLRTPFTPSDPLVVIWNPIEKLKKFAAKANLPYTDQQLVDFGLQLIRNTRDFEQGLQRWNEKPPVDQTWDNLKTHFRDEQEKLKKIRGPTMMQAGFAHANHIAEEIRTEIQASNAELINAISELGNEGNEYATANSAAMNATLENNLSAQMANMFKKVQAQLDQMKKEMKAKPTPVEGGSNENANGGNKKKRKTPDNPTFNRRTTSKYCWTHGGCAHNSNECTAKAEGHVDNATFEDKKGGSKAFCN